MRCLDPISILNDPKDLNRCKSATDCTSIPDSLCVRPDAKAQLLRLTVRLPPLTGAGRNEEVVLWSGPRREVWEEGFRAFVSMFS